jgi:succinate dehydrogenase / fumarate reductase flavoprotein subunit
MHHRHEMLDLVIVDGKARGIIARNLVTGEIERHSAHAVVIASGGYGNVFLSTNAMGVTLRQLGKYTRKGFLQILVTQNSPNMYSCFRRSSIKLTLMSESLRNDGRIWVPAKLEDAQAIRDGKKNQQNYLKKIEIII